MKLLVVSKIFLIYGLRFVYYALTFSYLFFFYIPLPTAFLIFSSFSCSRLLCFHIFLFLLYSSFPVLIFSSFSFSNSFSSLLPFQSVFFPTSPSSISCSHYSCFNIFLRLLYHSFIVLLLSSYLLSTFVLFSLQTYNILFPAYPSSYPP